MRFATHRIGHRYRVSKSVTFTHKPHQKVGGRTLKKREFGKSFPLVVGSSRSNSPLLVDDMFMGACVSALLLVPVFGQAARSLRTIYL